MKTLLSLSLLLLSLNSFSLFIDMNCSNGNGETFSYYQNQDEEAEYFNFSHNLDDITFQRSSTHSQENAESIQNLNYDNDKFPQAPFSKFELDVELNTDSDRSFYKRQHITSIKLTHFIPKTGSISEFPEDGSIPFEHVKDFSIEIVKKEYAKKPNSNKTKTYWDLVFISHKDNIEHIVEYSQEIKYKRCKILFSKKEVTNR